ncbi:oxidoreductase [Mycena floridula]|nr:oxidoreductase [Mycena floridula]
MLKFPHTMSTNSVLPHRSSSLSTTMAGRPAAPSATALDATIAKQFPLEGHWENWIPRLYGERKGVKPLGTVVFEEIEEKARQVLKDYPEAFMYANGNAGTWATYNGNLRAFQKYTIIPRMLVDASKRNLETTIFGVKHSGPIFMAPIGVQGIFTAEGELAPARAARALGVPFILSTASSRSIEEVAEANGDGHRWYQLYWPKTNEITLSVLRRAKANGYKALVVTLDTFAIGFRPHDLPKAYFPFGHGVGIEIGRSDPAFMAKHGRQPITDHHPEFPYDPDKMNKLFEEGDEETKENVYLGFAWLNEAASGTYRSWDDLKFLRDNWDGPLILKGIQSVKDAEKALDFGVDGIVVSNHGGRQVDGAIPSLYALANIMKSPLVKEAQKSGKLTVLFDSGIRTGSDIIKAIALGAQAVFMGRPWLYAGVVAGQAGIEQVLQHTMADLDSTLGLSGYSSLAELHGTAEESLQKVDF